jgi:quercetin dioxygenase-like cupin family protein
MACCVLTEFAMLCRLMILGLLAAPAAAAPVSWTPDAIPWQQSNPDGTRFALLEGVRDQAGVPFTYAFFIPAGVWDGPHSHRATARVVVARGNLRLGYGTQLDTKKAISFPVGSIVIVPAGADHFDGADEDTIIIGTAVGSWSTDYVDAKTKASAGAPPK